MNALLELPAGAIAGLVPSRFVIAPNSALRRSRYSDRQQGAFCADALTVTRRYRRQT
ncbi:hypothetical protein [Stutzerimonas stutzeri]|uniref:hypothetical protein n=1 Tax=Stutzerimonas stutzeri TaxID=316 RepID=UPI0004BCA6E4|nr:hypothetical protein [Stutzerimonas stutzeri]MCQ4327901.1 hypothetical protein [Stutzerimonas stutzeri]